MRKKKKINKLTDLYGDVRREGVQEETGRRYIRWTFVKGFHENPAVHGKDKKSRTNVQTAV